MREKRINLAHESDARVLLSCCATNVSTACRGSRFRFQLPSSSPKDVILSPPNLKFFDLKACLMTFAWAESSSHCFKTRSSVCPTSGHIRPYGNPRPKSSCKSVGSFRHLDEMITCAFSTSACLVTSSGRAGVREMACRCPLDPGGLCACAANFDASTLTNISASKALSHHLYQPRTPTVLVWSSARTLEKNDQAAVATAQASFWS